MFEIIRYRVGNFFKRLFYYPWRGKLNKDQAHYVLIFPRRIAFLLSTMILICVNRLWKETIWLPPLLSIVFVMLTLPLLGSIFIKRVYGERAYEFYDAHWGEVLWIVTIGAITIGGIISPLPLYIGIPLALILIGISYGVTKRLTIHQNRAKFGMMNARSLLWLLIAIPLVSVLTRRLDLIALVKRLL